MRSHTITGLGIINVHYLADTGVIIWAVSINSSPPQIIHTTGVQKFVIKKVYQRQGLALGYCFHRLIGQRISQCSRSVTFWYGSGSSDPYL